MCQVICLWYLLFVFYSNSDLNSSWKGKCFFLESLFPLFLHQLLVSQISSSALLRCFQGTQTMCDCSLDRPIVESMSQNQSDSCQRRQINSLPNPETYLKCWCCCDNNDNTLFLCFGNWSLIFKFFVFFCFLCCCWISLQSSKSKFVQFLSGYVYRGRCEILPCRAGPGPRPSAQPGHSLQRSQAREVRITDLIFPFQPVVA